ncbi:NF-kappa-B inhibitor zeta-like [Arapaima gigas]
MTLSPQRCESCRGQTRPQPWGHWCSCCCSPNCGQKVTWLGGPNSSNQGEVSIATAGSRAIAQGVCVRNPVKELIRLKRGGYLSPGPSKQITQESTSAGREPCAGEDGGEACTRTLINTQTKVLQQEKRAALGPTADGHCPKRPAHLEDTLLAPGSHDDEEWTHMDSLRGSKTYTDITDIIRHETVRPPVPIAAVQVQESGALAPPTPFVELKVLPPDHLSPLPTRSAGVVSFFQWQIEQEEAKLVGVSVEQLLGRDADGDTFLHVAVAQGRRPLAYVLARRMACAGMLDLKDHNGQSALQVSVAANQHLIVEDLLSLGAQVNTMDRWGRTPLHVCAEKAHALTLQAIHRALGPGQQLHLEAVNYDGLTALHTAVLAHNAVVRELGSSATPLSPATDALLTRRKLLAECVSTLLLMGASYRTKDLRSGRTCVHLAAEEANVELLRLLLDQPDSQSAVNDKAYDGNSVLHVVSALQGRVAQLEAVKLLLRKGADPSAKNLDHEQPLHLVPEGPTGEQVRRILKGRGSMVRSSTL